jgi:hypothetical protein
MMDVEVLSCLTIEKCRMAWKTMAFNGLLYFRPALMKPWMLDARSPPLIQIWTT